MYKDNKKQITTPQMMGLKTYGIGDCILVFNLENLVNASIIHVVSH